MNQNQRPFARLLEFDASSDSDDSDFDPGEWLNERGRGPNRGKGKKRGGGNDRETWGSISILTMGATKGGKSKNNSARAPQKKFKKNRGGTSYSSRSRYSLRQGVQSVANGGHILDQFPPEILVNVFRYGIAMEGFHKFIPRVSSVCHRWNQVSKHPLIWSSLNLPLASVKLTPTRANGLLQNDLSRCRHLNLSGQRHIPDLIILSFLKRMPALLSLNLENCYTIKNSLLYQLPDLTPQLKSLILSFTEGYTISISIAAIEYYLSKCGHNLEQLHLMRIVNTGMAARQIFTAIEDHCPNVRILNLSSPAISNYPTSSMPGYKLEWRPDYFFDKCPRIEELHVDGFNLVWPKSMGPYTEKCYIPRLKSLSIGFHRNETSDKPVFYSLFESVPSLQYLDISLSSLLANQVTTHLKHVTELVMRNMKWLDSQHTLLFECIDAWKHSLVRLDLSHNCLVDGGLDGALLAFGSKTDDYPLQSLDLKCSNVTVSPIQTILRTCRKLEKIDLTSCRELPRGCKHTIEKDEFDFLSQCLQDG